MKNLKKIFTAIAVTSVMTASITSMTAGATITEKTSSMTRGGVTCVDDRNGNIIFYPQEIKNTDTTYPIVVWVTKQLR